MLSMIVAHADNRVIGHQNDMPWHLPNDLRYFKEKTTGKKLLMGRKTFEAMNGPLKNRTNVVLTSSEEWQHEGAITVHSLEDGLRAITPVPGEEGMVIGGGAIYKAAMPFVDRLYITVIELDVEGDTVFPEYPSDEWELVSSEKGVKDEKNPYDYTFNTYDRIRKAGER